LLLDTRSKLDDVRKKLGKSNFKVEELEKMVNHLTQQLEEKDREIASLKAELENMNIEITALTMDVGNLKQQNAEKETLIKDQEGVINDKITELNTAYYVVGTKKDLKDNNIITAEGGFIGIGKNKKLKQDFNDKFFTKIDITKTTQIPIPGKKPKIITNHPTESYKISGEGDSAILEIINANSFWKSSKYLVVVID
jgi:regulator of replication initiation timing